MINEAPKPASDAERVKLLLEAATTAYAFLESYCTCASRNIAAKELRVAIKACTLAPPEWTP